MAAAPPRQRGAASVTATLALLVLLAVAAPRCRVARAQQEYEANAQDNCTRTDRSVLGYTCNATAAAAPCASYVVFRASSPYDSPVSISYLLNLTPAAVAGANAVPTVPPVAASRLLLAPLPCACAPQGYYQHNASYTIQQSTGEETYFTIANITYQGLSTCQALIAQNPRHDSLGLVKGNNLTVPVRCACPSPAQAAAGVRHLLVYLVTWGDSISAIADRFRVDAQAVLDANSISETDNIYPFTTLLIPLKTAPTADMLVSPAPPPAPAPPQAQPPTPPSRGSSSGVAVGVGVGVGGLALVGLLGLIFFCVRRRRRRALRSGEGEKDGGRPGKVVHDVPSSSDYDPLASGKHTAGTTTNTSSSYSSSALVSSDARAAAEAMTLYKYSDLEKATAGFSEERRIADASVYRAVINGDAAAVKRVAGDVSGEVGILKRVNHSSLVRLSGLCVHHGDTYLVFEYAENGALSDWLHGAVAGTLVWKQRVQAAFDVADGLNYLHNYTNPACVHKNLKSSNVLLDADLRAKVSSFALARSVPDTDNGAGQLTRHVVGTQGYLAPEYLEHGLITPKLDVFAFGVILLELLSGKEATFDGGDKRGETLLWESSAEGLVVAEGEDARGKVRAFMDPALQGDYPLDLAVAVASLALRCVAREPRARPSMDEVFVTLSAVYNSTLDWDPSDYGNSRSSILGR